MVWSHGTSGYADDHRVHIYVYITNTEGVMAILITSSSRGGHIAFVLIEKGPGPPSTSGYADGRRVQMSLSQIQKALLPF